MAHLRKAEYSEVILPILDYLEPYESLLTPHRQALHGAIGEAVETVYAGRLAQVDDDLAWHFSRAEEPQKALEGHQGQQVTVTSPWSVVRGP